MSETVTEKTKAPKKTSEELKKEAAVRDLARQDNVITMLKIGVTLKGEQKSKFFGAISGKKDYQLTTSQWKNVDELLDTSGRKVFKTEFLTEVKESYELTRKAGTYVSKAGKGGVRAKNGQSITRSVNERAMDEAGLIVNAPLSEAGTALGTAIDEMLKNNSAHLNVLGQNKLILKFYIRDLSAVKTEEAPAS